MNSFDPNWDVYTVKEHLQQIVYCVNRFEVSRDVKYLDQAEKHADAVRPYLPACWQELDLMELYSFYLSSASLFQGGT